MAPASAIVGEGGPKKKKKKILVVGMNGSKKIYDFKSFLMSYKRFAKWKKALKLCKYLVELN
jgi:hypothetical protein